MKRPLSFFGFTLFAVLLCLNLFKGTVFSVSLLILSVGLFLFSIINKKSRQSLILPVISLAAVTGCLLLLCFESGYNNTVYFAGENITVEGKVTESPCFSRENQRYYCVIKVKSLDCEKVSTKMRLSFSESTDDIDHSDLEIGDKVSFTATVYPMGSYNSTYKSYYKSQKTYLGAYSIEKLTITESKYKPVSYYIDALRDSVTENFLHDFDSDVATLLIALLTGDKSLMEEGIYEDFKLSGVVHIMAVSGMHLSIWVTFLGFFIDFRGGKGKIMSVLMILFTVFMMNFAFFTGSVKRAAMMTILTFIGKILGKKADSLNSLGFAAICVLVVNPFAVADISFVLSFVSTLGIIVLGIPLCEKLIRSFIKRGETVRKNIYPFVMSLSISVSVSVFTLPVSVYYFGGISLAAPITNLLFLFTVSPLIVLTGLYTFLRFVPFVSSLVAVAIKYISLYMLGMAEKVSALPFAYLYVDSDILKISLYAVFLFLVLAMIFHKYSRILTRVTAILSVGIFVLSLGVNFYSSLNKCKITVFGAEGGNCAIVSYNGQGVLVGFEGDAYSEETLKEEVKSHNIKISSAVFFSDIITKNQKNVCHSLGADNILTAEGTSVCLFGKVTVKKGESSVLIESPDTKTYIFYKDPLQEGVRYDIMTDSGSLPLGDYENNYAFSVGESNPHTVIVRSNSIKVRGESSWLNLMKKVLKVT